MNKSTIQDCISRFKTLGLDACEDDGSVYLRVNDKIEVQLSTTEVIFRADQHLHAQSVK